MLIVRPNRFREKVKVVLKATKTHARNLATFAFVYKSVMLFLRHVPRTITNRKQEASYDTFIAGLVGGYYVFGRGIQSSVNQQIVIYVFARVVLGLAKMAVQEGGMVPARMKDSVTGNAWPVFASLSWGAVMWLFRWHPQSLQPSLRSSMVYM